MCIRDRPISVKEHNICILSLSEVADRFQHFWFYIVICIYEKDVYKRQGQELPLLQHSDGGHREKGCTGRTADHPCKSGTDPVCPGSPWPVSYTHLDVYKRQVPLKVKKPPISVFFIASTSLYIRRYCHLASTNYKYTTTGSNYQVFAYSSKSGYSSS